ncbi:response regulator transcription factor [Burkholderia cenocepacia]|jgi:DNA-binding NarL/FixJ family response regulator|uniref:response regulator transcription factor n=1 Tax=Burkholderia cenocepacia TaxID=95486 RepID=UPI0004F6AB94|nr:response regulator transcription factor [Burkholderia cenocepacia]AIO46582.1 bacterial regulatory s, luxR family protein [Burkholderia cepacia]KGC01699.1 bacterial regulatory s, luxR family protein [Burkholderia cepacia]MCG0581874.1 response regulator transcription factor [Burkholderia cenocepacia]MCW3522706.1 response regulator transcription factor [Burkholderia cenocepacia]MCW3613148.1 response regulator transcription factor [Burkholderia cenocepacia]
MGKFSVKTIFVNDCPLVVAGMEHITINSGAIDLVGTCGSMSEMIALLPKAEFDVVVVDCGMRGSGNMEGIELVGYLRRTYPDVGIVTLIGYESPVVVRSIIARGVSSIVSKLDESGHIVTAIHSAYCGGNYQSPAIKASMDSVAASHGRGGRWLALTPKESEVVRLYLSGLSITEIAERLRKGKQTVSAQKISAMKKLGVKSDVELATCAAQLRQLL